MKLCLVLGDQLSRSLSSLVDLDPQNDIFLMCEVRDEATYVKHHKKKIAFVFSAMRHFAKKLLSDGYNVHYIKYDDQNNTGSLFGEVARLITQHEISEVIVTAPGVENSCEWSIFTAKCAVNIPS
jgi:deoxyribodipyrimidine photolyase-related protein